MTDVEEGPPFSRAWRMAGEESKPRPCGDELHEEVLDASRRRRPKVWVCNRTAGHDGPHRRINGRSFAVERAW